MTIPDEIEGDYDCGCQILWNQNETYIKWCPLHKNAEAMLRGLEAAIAALDASADYVTESVYAQMWALCNGYESSPDIKAIVAKAKGE